MQMVKVLCVFLFAMILIFIAISVNYALIQPLQLRHFLNEANNGDSSAQVEVARRYMVGLGVKKDVHEAISWFRRAASLKNPVALNALGDVYRRGIGVKQDGQEALRWYFASAELEYGPAEKNIGDMYLFGNVVRYDIKEAIYWYELAAGHGAYQAMHRLGWIFENGVGVSVNNAIAVMWHEIAASEGCANSKHSSIQLYARMTQLEKIEAKTLIERCQKHKYKKCINN